MDTKFLNILFVTVLMLILIFLAAIIVIGLFEEEENFGGLQESTGSTITFEVTHKGQYIPQYITTRSSERYDDKYFEYLESIQESRDKTFLR